MDLLQLWQRFTNNVLVPTNWGYGTGDLDQIQGTCGVYSFWYATILLRLMDSTGRPEVHPRKLGRTTIGTSMREFTKNHLNSGQGELLSLAEMLALVRAFGYKAEGCTGGAVVKKRFITSALGQSHPVLIAYWCGDNDYPVSTHLGGNDGAHWSLIIKEEGSEYVYIDPNVPTAPKRFDKDQFLESNAKVDNKKFVRYWGKAFSHDLRPLGNRVTPFVGKIYDVAKGGRDQKLKDVLVAVH